MSTQEMEFAGAVAAPDRVGQGTAVEQSRAVASVQAMVVLARQFPRDEKIARAKMIEACRSPELAEKGLYAYVRGGKTVSGLTIAAVVEIARCWGNLQYGLTEMRRDDVYGQSEMQAHAWDLETNVPNQHTFVVQHVRGRSRLTDPRDVYELNTNEGNRRMREAILRQLPRWYKVAAEETLRATLRAMAAGNGKSLEERIEGAVAFFADSFSVEQEQLEAKLGAARRRWSEDDVVELRILADSLKRRDLTLEDAFPSKLVTAEELAPEQPRASAESEATTPAAPVEHLDHPEGEWMDGCPGCMAESVAADKAAEDEDEGAQP